MNFLARLEKRSRSEKNGDLPDFAGKILVIYPSSEGIGGGIFQDAKAVSIGFNVFVVGRRVGLEPPLQDRWSRATVWTSIHQIAQMLVFDDIESAKAAFERGETEVKSDSV
jgi:hypothetical protein